MAEFTPTDQIFIRKLTEIILTNLGNEAFGVKELAYESGIGLHSLNRKLSSINKKTINQFIREVRLQKALEILKTESLTVNEVAFKVGFSSPTYFNSCFSKFFGYPPGKVKKEGLVGTEENILTQNTAKQEQKKPIRQTIVFSIPWILLICTFIVIAALLVVYIQDRRQSKAIAKLEKSVAVLPFINDSPDQENTYFINGIMEEVLNNLQKIKDFRVLSRNSVEQFRNNTTKSTPEIAKKLGVNYIVEGEGQKYGNIFRLRVKLIKAPKEGHLWAESYEKEIRETKDIYGIQSEIAQYIASALRATITPEEKQLINKIPSTNLTAFDFYQQGREEYTKGSLDKAEDLYRKSLKYDSTFAQAYSGLAKVYWDKHYWKEYLSKNFMDSVLILTNIALSFDDKLSEAYTLRGKYYNQIEKPELAIEEFDKAIKLNPNDWMAYLEKGGFYFGNNFVNTINYYQKAASINRGPELPSLLGEIAYAYLSSGFPDKAKQCYQDKLKLDGDSLAYYAGLQNNEFWVGNFNKSVEYGKKGFAIDTTNDFILLDLGHNYAWLGRFKESLRYYKKWLERLKAQGELNINNMYRIGYAYWQCGYKVEAEYLLNEQLEYCTRKIELKRSYESYAYYDLAAVYAFKGEKDKAYKNLRIFDQRQKTALWIPMIMLIRTDPLFASIRNEPEFQQVVKDVEVKNQAEHERVRKWLEKEGIL